MEWTAPASTGSAGYGTSLLATALAFTGANLGAALEQWSCSPHRADFFASEPVFAWATFLDLMAGEVLSRRATLGAFLILSGILIVELKPMRFLQRQENQKRETRN